MSSKEQKIPGKLNLLRYFTSSSAFAFKFTAHYYKIILFMFA